MGKGAGDWANFEKRRGVEPKGAVKINYDIPITSTTKLKKRKVWNELNRHIFKQKILDSQ